MLLYSAGGISAEPPQRLTILRDSEDGFAIAEADLVARGGELLGVQQSGQMSTIFMDMQEHYKEIEPMRDEAKALLAADPELATPRGEAAQILMQLFEREYQ